MILTKESAIKVRLKIINLNYSYCNVIVKKDIKFIH